MTFPEVLSWLAIAVALFGAIVCLVYAIRCHSDDRAFYFLAGILQLFTVIIYSLALAGDWYIVKTGILSRLALIMYAGLLASWAIAHMRKCERGRG